MGKDEALAPFAFAAVAIATARGHPHHLPELSFLAHRANVPLLVSQDAILAEQGDDLPVRRAHQVHEGAAPLRPAMANLFSPLACPDIGNALPGGSFDRCRPLGHHPLLALLLLWERRSSRLGDRCCLPTPHATRKQILRSLWQRTAYAFAHPSKELRSRSRTSV